MSEVYIPIEKDFYEKVEQKNYLKHILYGDSVYGLHCVEFIYKGKSGKETLANIWNIMSTQYEVTFVVDKEYIFFTDDNFLIQNYDVVKDEVIFVKPTYLMRYIHKGPVYHNYLTNDRRLTTTLNHSYVDIDVKNRCFKKKTAAEIQTVPVLMNGDLQVPLKFALMYGKETKYDYLGTVRKSRANEQILFNVRPYKLCKKEKETDFNDYMYDFEVPSTHVFIVDGVIVHNTDSLFIQIPQKPDDIVDKVKLVHKTSTNINDLIVGYNKNYLLPRCGFSPERNETKFKEEMIIDKIIMLDVKKSYAYRLIASEATVDEKTNKIVAGKVFDNPIIEKKSGLGVKSDTITLTKSILDFLINLALGDSVKKEDKYKVALQELAKFDKEFKECLKNFDFVKIGTPVRWQKKINAINAMKLYNAIVEKAFQYLSTGHLLYCKFASQKAINDLDIDIDSGKLNAIAIPLKFNKDRLKESLQKYGISFDIEKQWNNIYNKTCQRIIAGLKSAAE